LLDTALLGALDRGYVYKRLSAGKLEYVTNITLWTGTQPVRFDLSSGLGRRFHFLLFLPTRETRMLLRKARRAARYIRPNIPMLRRIRDEINRRIDYVRKVKEIEFTTEYDNYLEELDIEHYEDITFENISIGYKVMASEPERVLKIDLDEGLERMLKILANDRMRIRYGSLIVQIRSLLLSYGGRCDLKQLKKDLISFGLDWVQATEAINRMLNLGLVKVVKGEVVLK